MEPRHTCRGFFNSVLSNLDTTNRSAKILGVHEILVGDVLPWSRVAEIHKIRNGIYQRSGRLISLLTDFGRINPCYPDFHGETPDMIHYTGSGRRGDQKLGAANRALINAITTSHAVPLFNKLAVNCWQYLGQFNVIDAHYIHDDTRDRRVWRFTLQKLEIPN